MEYKVTRKEVQTGRIFETICTQDQVNNITKYPCSLYSLESIDPITEKPEQEHKKAGRPITVNTVKELNRIIKTGKREITGYINTDMDRSLIYNWIELVKKDCRKYSESNKTTKQIYFNFLTWLNKIDKQLFPEFY
jgi:hypothetical protein